MAFCLNLYDDMCYSDLNLIRKIRNTFAHKLHGFAFGNDPIRAWCAALQFPDDWCDGYNESIDDVCGHDPRQRFIFTCALTSMYFESHYLKKATAVNHALLNTKVPTEEYPL